jgi:hypothetical protein
MPVKEVAVARGAVAAEAAPVAPGAGAEGVSVERRSLAQPARQAVRSAKMISGRRYLTSVDLHNRVDSLYHK